MWQTTRCRHFAGWDYAKGASLFITVATMPRRLLFGKIVNGDGDGRSMIGKKERGK